jgi:hypothetical protein
LDARLGDVRSALGGEIGASEDAAVAAFDEAEALNAMLNYRHAELRRRVNAGDLPLPDVYRRLRDSFAAIGAPPEGASAPLGRAPQAVPATSAAAVRAGRSGTTRTSRRRSARRDCSRARSPR